MFITADSIFGWGVVGGVCGVLVLLEAFAIAVLLRNTERRFWRRKFVLTTAALGVGMMIYAWQAFRAYDTLHGRVDLARSDVMAVSQWGDFGNLALWVTIILLCVGASYVWLARD